MIPTKKYIPLVMMFIISDGIHFGVNKYINAMGSGGYISSLIWILVAIVVYSLLYNQKATLNFFVDKSILKKVILIFTFVIAMFNLSASTAHFSNYFAENFYRASPFWFVLSLLIIPSAVGCAFGLKAVSRYAVPAIAIIVLLTASILILSSSGYCHDNLYPLSGRGTKGIITSIKGATCFGGILYYYILLFSDKNLAKLKSQKPVLIICLSGIFIFFVCLCCNLLLPQEAASLVYRPLYTIASSVGSDYLIERSEVLVLIIWLLSAFITISGIGAVISHMLSVEFNLESASPFTACIYAIVFATVLLFDKYNITESMYRYSIYATSAVSVILPLVVNAGYYLKSNGAKI